MGILNVACFEIRGHNAMGAGPSSQVPAPRTPTPSCPLFCSAVGRQQGKAPEIRKGGIRGSSSRVSIAKKMRLPWLGQAMLRLSPPTG